MTTTMGNFYKIFSAFAVAISLLDQASGQGTHYGIGAGTQGVNHAFFGIDAGKMNVGNDNTFMGSSAGIKNQSGAQNTFIGSRAGEQNEGPNASGNTFVGFRAGGGNGNALSNTFLGNSSGGEFKGGEGNVGVGSHSLHFGSGKFSVAVGHLAGEFNSADHNVFVGANSGRENKSGTGNAFFGSGSGLLNTIGVNNTFIGTKAGGNSVADNNSFLGHNSGLNNETGNSNTFSGSQSGLNNKAGHYNSFFGSHSGSSNVQGIYNTYIGYNSGGTANLQYATAIGAGAQATKDHSIILGTIFDYVGIGVSAPAYQFQVSTFSAAKAGSSTWIVASDKRLKKDVSEYQEGLDLLKQIKPVWFSYNGEADMPTDKKFVGVIAQDMQKIASHMVGTFTYQDSLGNKTEYLDYDANALTYMLVNAVKEQQQVIEEKEGKMQEMTTQMTELTNRLAHLEKIVAASTIKPLTGNPAARQLGESNANGVVLEQNVPNGFSGNTSIHYFIPKSVQDAVIHIYSIDGKKINTHTINQRGQGELQLSADQFNNGVVVYDLVTDGKSNGAKKMMVNK